MSRVRHCMAAAAWVSMGAVRPHYMPAPPSPHHMAAWMSSLARGVLASMSRNTWASVLRLRKYS